MNNQTHWTERSTADFQHRIVADFVNFIETTMDSENINQSELASRLGVSEGRVSQVLNSPGNLTLKKMIEYARAVGRKISIVGYDDGDVANVRGPIHADIFSNCWERFEKPNDFFAIQEHAPQRRSGTPSVFNILNGEQIFIELNPELLADNSAQSQNATTGTNYNEPGRRHG